MFKILKMIKVGYGKGTKRQTTIDSLHAKFENDTLL
jgi:hypothetical protein